MCLDALANGAQLTDVYFILFYFILFYFTDSAASFGAKDPTINESIQWCSKYKCLLLETYRGLLLAYSM